MDIEATLSKGASVRTERFGPVLEVTLDRPKANAIDAATSRLLGEAFAAFRDDETLAVAILTGGGQRFFSAGWDLKAAAAGEPVDADYGVGGFGGLQELPGLDKPVIAAVNGLAVGGGFELALAADLIIAAEHAQFALPEARLGILADAASITLPRRVGHNVACDLLFSGRFMDAEEARRRGLVCAVHDAAKLCEAARRLAARIAEASPRALAAVKQVLRATAPLSVNDAFALVHSDALPAVRALERSGDGLEGARAFVEGRAPCWSTT